MTVPVAHFRGPAGHGVDDLGDQVLQDGTLEPRLDVADRPAEVAGDEVEDRARGEHDELSVRSRDRDRQPSRLEQKGALGPREVAIRDGRRDDDQLALSTLEPLDRVDRVGDLGQLRAKERALGAVRDDDPDAMANAVRLVLSTRDAAREAGARGRALVEREHSAARFVEAMDRVTARARERQST